MTVPLQCKHKATQTSRASTGGQSPCALELPVLPASAPGAPAPVRGASQRGAVCRGTEQAVGFCPSPCTTLRPWQKETSQAGQTCCLLSLIAALCMSQSGSWLLPLHRIVSSHSPSPTGLTAFPLQLTAQLCLTGSVLPFASQRHLLSLPPPIHSVFLFLATTLLFSLILSFAWKSKKQWGCTVGTRRWAPCSGGLHPSPSPCCLCCWAAEVLAVPAWWG